MRILIAEDDAASCKILEAILRSLGHEVVAASNGQEAWEAFDRDPVRLIVSDWLMAVVDGLTLCKKVRARLKTPYTYFIMLTARTDREKYEEAMAGGVDDFLAKPLSRTELTIRLRVAERILGYTTQIRELKKLLPICMYCKKIRDDKDYWHGVEAYIHAHTGTDFSHSICPVCYEQHVKPQLAELGCEQETPV